MPAKLERELKVRAKKKGFGKKRTGAYVYGTLRKTGWTPSTQKKKPLPLKKRLKRKLRKRKT